MFAVCCPSVSLFVVRCLSFVVWCSSFVVCCSLCVVSLCVFVACCLFVRVHVDLLFVVC